jgi:hypothetical protein
MSLIKYCKAMSSLVFAMISAIGDYKMLFSVVRILVVLLMINMDMVSQINGDYINQLITDIVIILIRIADDLELLMDSLYLDEIMSVGRCMGAWKFTRPRIFNWTFSDSAPGRNNSLTFRLILAKNKITSALALFAIVITFTAGKTQTFLI